MNPEYPVYVPTKGRFKNPLTIRALQACEIPFRVVAVPGEVRDYAKVVEKENILVLPSDIKGLVPTRNWIWEHAISEGAERHWTFDDNIRAFYRLNKNQEYQCTSGTFLKVIEDFVNRYENVAVAGMQYEMFLPRKSKFQPFALNKRVYSNMLIKNDIPFRNRGVYNDDTDLCLRILKSGLCTVLFNAFLAAKIQTMRIKGGNTDIYQADGRLKMAQELQARHPDCVKITWKWGRWQHSVDYSKWKNNKLIRKKGVEIPKGIDNYGLVNVG